MGVGDKVQGISWDTCPASDLNRTHLLSQRWVNKAPLIGREETEARCGRVRQSRKGRCDFLGESSPAPACSPCIPSREAFFPTPGGGAALLRGYRLGEDRGTQGWGVAHKSSPGGGRREAQDARNTHAGGDLAPEKIRAGGQVGQGGDSNYAKGGGNLYEIC